MLSAAVFGLALIIVPAWACGCISSEGVALGDARFMARAKDYPIQVFIPLDAPVAILKAAPDAMRTSEIPFDAQLIGRVDVEGDASYWGMSSWSKMINSAKSRARKLGGDAIVLRGGGESKVGAPNGGTFTYRSLNVYVLRYGVPGATTRPFPRSTSEKMLVRHAPVGGREASS